MAEKHKWIKTLLGLKDETKPDTHSGKLSLANLLYDLGRLYDSLGEYEQALKYYYQARGDYDVDLDYLLKFLELEFKVNLNKYRSFKVTLNSKI